ncbi:hypothetical protein PGT21_028786 [Puccinia graminis f. sp. tritici]|uniref:Uncharacterized protein n=2 Tax=Puccinia graminis f. sp. tritici TaxID=56615 RepID=A0A5B0PE86_PUCGR|nr:hypothetical protein PGT21_028786 [Puccinia graminis f. sp. tritici]
MFNGSRRRRSTLLELRAQVIVLAPRSGCKRRFLSLLESEVNYRPLDPRLQYF